MEKGDFGHICIKPYVYIVLEHAFGTKDCKIHGVYTTRLIAQGKKTKLKAKGSNGYIAILKKPIEGRSSKIRILYKGKNKAYFSVMNHD